MTNLVEVENYDEGVYQFELTDPIRGGADGVDNRPLKNLANRTKWLKAQIIIIANGLSAHLADTDPHTQYLREADEPTQAEVEAGTVATVRAWSALRVKQAITAIAGSLISNHSSATDPHTQYATKVGVQDNSHNHATAGGTSDAITAVFSPAITALVEGMTVFVKIGTTNGTTTPTLKVDGTAVATIAKGANLALRMHDLQGIAEFKWNATLSTWLLKNPDTGTSGIVASGINIITATSALSYAMAGGLVRFNSATAIVPTLPANSTYAPGKLLRMINNNTGIATVTCAGTDVIKVNDMTVTALALGKGDTLELISDNAGTWYAVGGSSQLLYSTIFGVTATTGYKKIGSLIVQGLIGTTTLGVGNFTYPVAFPNRVIGVVPQLTNDAFIGAACFLSIGTNSLTGGRVIAGNGAGGATAYGGGSVGYQLIAIGD
jgi:hypothetical protein